MKLAIPAALVAGSGALYYFFGNGAMRALSIVCSIIMLLII